jgi:thiamine-phosphate pyrophosphorylase
MVEQALDGGALAVQYRSKLSDAALRAVRDVAFVVNDSVDLALACAADGVHLGRDDAPVAEARARLGAAKIIGASCYDSLELARAAQAAGADYVAFGSVFPSQVKPGAVRATLDLLWAARREMAIPIVAIGGIDAHNVPLLIARGIDAVAVITGVFGEPDIASAAASIAGQFAGAP